MSVDFYKKELGAIDGIKMMPVNTWDKPNFWLSCMTLTGNQQCNKSKIMV